MAKRVWTLDLQDGRHTVELEHGYFSGKKTIQVDGATVHQSANRFDLGGHYPIEVAGHPAAVAIAANGVTFSYDLAVDRVSVQSGKKVLPPLPTPRWAWLFIVASLLIPVITLGGAVPTLLGMSGAFASWRVARDGSRGSRSRVALCVGATVLCWVLFFGFLVVVGVLAGGDLAG